MLVKGKIAVKSKSRAEITEMSRGCSSASFTVLLKRSSVSVGLFGEACGMRGLGVRREIN